MRIRPGVVFAVVAVLAILFGGRQLGWFGGKASSSSGPVAGTSTSGEAEGPSQPTTVSVTPAPPAPAAPSVTPAVPAPSPRPAAVAAAPTTQAPATGLITDWEQRIDTLLTTAGDESAKSKELLSLLPNLPEDGQVEAAQHLSNLLADEDFKLLTPTLTNAAMPEAVLDVLMTDVLNRPNGLKLTALLDVARVPNHPKAEEARDILEVYVDENFGENWAGWQSAIDKWLKENPDE